MHRPGYRLKESSASGKVSFQYEGVLPFKWLAEASLDIQLYQQVLGRNRVFGDRQWYGPSFFLSSLGICLDIPLLPYLDKSPGTKLQCVMP